MLFWHGINGFKKINSAKEKPLGIKWRGLFVYGLKINIIVLVHQITVLSFSVVFLSFSGSSLLFFVFW